ncbi:MAG: recombinase family protein [Eubacteriales bacterium]|nr:recombinase family protein [Eubacteriales bacterium]
MEDTDKFIAVYSRKSKFTGKGESIENQIGMCRKYIETHHGPESLPRIRVYEDEGFSGGTLNRPQFKSMIQDAKDGKICEIIVYRLDRISRNIGDFSRLIEELQKMDITFVSITENFETESPMGRAMMYIASVFSQLERETIAERIRDNMHELAKTGRWLGGTTPTGYGSESVSNVTIDGKKKKACRLKLLPEEAKVVELIYEKFLETESLSQTETYLLLNGYKTKNSKPYSRFSIKNILSNPVYMIADEDAYHYLLESEAALFSEKESFNGKYGIMAYNRTIQKTGKTNKLREKKEWIVSVGRHPGIIAGKTWIKVQKLLERNRSKAYPSSRSNVALLSGLLCCGSCGDHMRPKIAHGTYPGGTPNYYYLCTTKEKSKRKLCSMKNPDGNLLDQMVIEEIKKLTSDRHLFIKLLEHGRGNLCEEHTDYSENTARLNQQITENLEKIQALTAALSTAACSSAEKYIVKEIEDLDKKTQDLKDQLKQLEKLNSRHAQYDMEFTVIKNMVHSFGSTIDQMNLFQKRTALRSIVKKIIWDGKNAHIYLFTTDEEYEFLENLPLISETGTDFQNKAPSGEDSK